MKFADLYPFYVQKAQRKERTADQVNEIICYLTGHTPSSLHEVIEQGVDVETFFTTAPAMNPRRNLITGSVCGVKLDQIEDPLMREIRYLDKLIDELSKGKAMEKILR